MGKSDRRLVALGGAVAPELISQARWSPDGSRLLFRKLSHPVTTSDAGDDPEAEDPMRGDFWTVRSDGGQLRRLTFNGADGGGPYPNRARWVDDAAIQVEYSGVVDSQSAIMTSLARVTADGAYDCWTSVPSDGTPVPSALKLGADACQKSPVADPNPQPKGDPQPQERQPQAEKQAEAKQQTGQQARSGADTKPKTAPAGPPIVQVLAVGKHLGGKNRNLVTVKFKAPAGSGVRLWLMVPSTDGTGASWVLGRATLTAAQAARGTVRLRLRASGRKRFAQFAAAVTVRASVVAAR